MPNNSQYTTITEVENYLLQDIGSSFELQITDWIIAMSNQVSLMTNREWLASDTASDRYFNGNSSPYLKIDEAVSVTKLYVGEDYGVNFVEKTNFITYPYNSTPVKKLILTDDTFNCGIKNIKITAKWGYALEVPKDIAFATTVLVAGIVLNQTNQDGEIESEKIGNYAVSYKTDEQKNDYKMAMDIINSRRIILL